MKNRTTISIIMILIAASGWGLIGVFTRPLTSIGLNAIQITFLRCIIVAIAMGIFLFIKDKALLRVRLKDFWIFLGTGLVSIVFFNVCYFLTIERTTLAIASILLYTAPCFVMLMSVWIFKEKITIQKLAALVLAFLGCMLVSGFAGGDISLFVFMTGIGAGAGYAAYSIFGKVALRKYHTFTVIFYTFVVATLGLLPFAQIQMLVPTLAGDWSNVLIALGLGIFSTFLPFIFYTSGLQYVEAGKASVMAFVEPMVATIAGIIIFHEDLYFKNAVGILLIFWAIILLNIPLEKRSKEQTV